MKLLKTAALAAALSCTLLVAGSGYSAPKLPDYGWERDYFSDASKTEVVGNGTLTCNANLWINGEETPYYTTVATWKCNNPTYPAPDPKPGNICSPFLGNCWMVQNDKSKTTNNFG